MARAIDADLAAGLRPLAVVAAAGATNTGVVDPLPELAEICRARAVWLHVDAAYGGFAALTERGRRALAGLELADSVTLDPHKWLYQPIECGCVLVREGELLRRAFEIEQDYLADAAGAAGEVNFGDLGLQLTRGFRALKVWLSVNLFGAAAFREAIDRALDLAELARTLIAADDRLETIAAGDLGITCFRRRVAGGEEQAAAANAALVAAYEASGMGLVLSTRVDGRYAVRLCILNHTTRAEDVEAAVAFFAGAPLDPEPRSNGARSPHMMDVGSGWLRSASELADQGRRPGRDDVHAELGAGFDGARGDGRVAGQSRVVGQGERGEAGRPVAGVELHGRLEMLGREPPGARPRRQAGRGSAARRPG